MHSNLRKIPTNSRGFTLLELMIVLMIIATMLTVVIPYSHRSGNNQKLKQESLNITEALHFAKDIAQTTRKPTRVVINRESNSLCLEIYNPDNYENFAPLEGDMGLPHYLDKSLYFSTDTESKMDEKNEIIVFDPGKPWPTGTVSLSNEESISTITFTGTEIKITETEIENKNNPTDS